MRHKGAVRGCGGKWYTQFVLQDGPVTIGTPFMQLHTMSTAVTRCLATAVARPHNGEACPHAETKNKPVLGGEQDPAMHKGTQRAGIVMRHHCQEWHQ